MRIKNAFHKILVSSLAVGMFAVMPLASAEVREYEGFGEYIMSDFETPDIAKQRAKARAEQNAMEQAGVYVESFTKVINARVTHDEINVITNGILKVKDTQYTMTPTGDGKSFIIQSSIKADIDTDDISKWLAQNKQEKDMLIVQNKELQKAKAEQDKQIEELKKQIANARSIQEKETAQTKINTADQEFLSNQKMEEGLRLGANGDRIGAVVMLSQAVELNPQNAHAFSGLGGIYAELGDERKAIENCNKAINLSPDVWAYESRGLAYARLGEYAKAIADFTKAIELDAKDAWAYVNRGVAYARLREHAKAIVDFTMTIELDTQNAEVPAAYCGRGFSYMQLRNYAKAIEDFTKAIELNPKDSVSYKYRGLSRGIFNRAYALEVSDLTKSIELDPKDGEAYFIRGLAYQDMKDYTKANADFAMAKSLGCQLENKK